MRLIPCVLLSFIGLGILSAEAIGGIGYRYDGTGLAPESWKPPTTGMDGESGKGLRWKIPTANWGYACPVEVEDQVLVMCEPGNEDLLWPTLVSYDRATGEERWRTAIDILAAHNVSDAERKTIEEDWTFYHETWRFLYSTANGYGQADEATRKAIDDKLKTRDFSLTEWKKGYGLLRYLKNNNERFKDVSRKYAPKYGLKTPTWQEFSGSRVGAAFPTPVTDGRNIVVITMYGAVACLDIEGKLKWIHDTGYRQPGHAGTGSSPRIADGKALFNMNSQTWAYDLETGKQLWTVGKTGDKWVNGHGVYASPVVMEVDGTLILVDGNSRLIRISDGKHLDLVDPKGQQLKGKFGKKKIETTGEIAKTNYMPFGVDRDKQELFISGKQHLEQFGLTPFPDKFGKSKPPQLVGFALRCEGDTVTVTPTKLQVPGGQGGVAFGDKLYIPGRIIDRATLEGASADKKAPKRAADTRHIFMLANGHTFGMKAEYNRDKTKPRGCVLNIYDLDGKLVSEVLLPWIDPKSDIHVQKVWDQGITATNYACSFNLGRDCIYARDNAYLYCFGK